jgi:hypothetical protein
VAHRMLWVVAITMAAAALVAGCVNVNVPKGPYATVNSTRPISAQDRARAAQMDRKELEEAYLRAAADNDALHVQVDDLKRQNKQLKGERDNYKDEAERLSDQLKKR